MQSRCLSIGFGVLLIVLGLLAAAYGADGGGRHGPSSGASSAADPGPQHDASIRAVDGVTLRPFAPPGPANVVFFLQSDCPISNGYAPEIQRVCREYGARGVGCSLMYEDVELPSAAEPLEASVRAHRREYRLEGLAAAVDRTRAMASRAGATVTPQAVVIDRAGEIRYRGRIDNLYASLGRTRRQVTEHDLRDALDAVLAGRPVARPETQALGCYIVDPALLRK